MDDLRTPDREGEPMPNATDCVIHLLEFDPLPRTVSKSLRHAGEHYNRAAVQLLIECWNTSTLPPDTAFLWGTVTVTLPSQHPDGSPNTLTVPNVMLFQARDHMRKWILPSLGPNVELLRAAVTAHIITKAIRIEGDLDTVIAPYRWRETLETMPAEGNPEAYEVKPQTITERALQAHLRKIRLERTPIKTLARYVDAGLLPSSRDTKFIGDEDAASGMRRYPLDTIDRLKAIDNFLYYTSRTLEQISSMLQPAWRPANHKVGKRT